MFRPHIEGILPKGPYLPCVSMAGRALLAGYPRYVYSSRIIWSAIIIITIMVLSVVVVLSVSLLLSLLLLSSWSLLFWLSSSTALSSVCRYCLAPLAVTIQELVTVTLKRNGCYTGKHYINITTFPLQLTIGTSFLLARFSSHRYHQTHLNHWYTSRWRHNECNDVSNYGRSIVCPTPITKKNIKAPLHWPLWGKSTGHRCIPLTKGQ